MTCQVHQGPIPQEERLTGRCSQWVLRSECEIGRYVDADGAHR